MSQTKTFSGEPEGGKTPAHDAVSQPPVLVQVYLWDATAEIPPPALAMVADLLQVRGGDLRDSTTGLIAASFTNPVVAVNAARNLQRLIQGFSRAWQGGALEGCTILMRATETSAGVEAVFLRENHALKQTHPGQVIVVGTLCDAARSIPGLEFRPLGQLGKNGAAQQALHLLPPTRMEGYVEEPFEAKAVSPEPPVAATEVAARALAEPVAPPRTPAYVLPSMPVSGKTTAVASAPASSPASGAMRAIPPAPVVADEIGAFSREEKAASQGISRWVLLGGAAVAVVVGVLVFTPILRKPHPVASPAQPIAEPAQPASSTPEPTAAPTAVPSSVETRAPILATPVKPKPTDTAHNKVATQEEPAPAAPVEAPAPVVDEARPAHGLTFTPAEISSLIAHADKDSGNGNFDKAIQEYRLVLSREPANDLAKRGLARALYNKEHQ